MRIFPIKVFRNLAMLGILTLITGFAAAEPLKVVASFSILGDLTQQVGGARVQVHTLVGQDAMPRRKPTVQHPLTST